MRDVIIVNILVLLLAGCIDVPTVPIMSEIELENEDVKDAVWNSCYTGKFFIITILDNYYLGYSIEQLNEKLEIWHETIQGKREPDYFDCDNLAISMMALVTHPVTGLRGVPFGIATLVYWNDSNAHAVNIFVDSSLVVWFYDPKLGISSLKKAEEWLGRWKVSWIMI